MEVLNRIKELEERYSNEVERVEKILNTYNEYNLFKDYILYRNQYGMEYDSQYFIQAIAVDIESLIEDIEYCFNYAVKEKYKNIFEEVFNGKDDFKQYAVSTVIYGSSVTEIIYVIDKRIDELYKIKKYDKIVKFKKENILKLNEYLKILKEQKDKELTEIMKEEANDSLLC